MKNKSILLILILLIFSCSTLKNRSDLKQKEKDLILKEQKNQQEERKKEEIKKDKSPKEIYEQYLEERAKQKMESMSLIEKRGLLCMVNIFDTELTQETIQFLNKNKIKGIILFKYNIKNESQLKKLINDLRESVDRDLLIAIDQEGGKIARIQWEETAKISPKFISFNKNPENFAYEVAYKRGKYLKSLGINVVLGPVVDIPSSKSDFIYERSFGTNIEEVCKLTIAMIKGYRDADIISVLKHFPGHGKTRVDSHYEFPVINKTIEELKKEDLLPFIYGIENNVPMIMMGHIINSYIDKERPASLSYNYVNLLNSLNFKGVIITDDLAMTGKITKGIGWGINIITGKTFKDIQKLIDTIEPIDYYVNRVIKLIYFREEIRALSYDYF